MLLYTEERQFTAVIPYLSLFATLVFIFSPQITRLARRMTGREDYRPWLFAAALYIAIAIYGGFFGAGLSIRALAALALLGHDNMHRMNALKTLQAALVNGIAVVTLCRFRSDCLDTSAGYDPRCDCWWLLQCRNRSPD